jgi:hypothetical protein
LEDISSGTIASGGNLGLDSNNKIVKQADTGITDLHGAGVDGSRGYVLTDNGDGTVTSEANLTFNGDTLNVKAGSNTTENALYIDANSLTTGSAIWIDVDDAITTTNERDLLLIDFDKSGVTADGASAITTGLKIDIRDSATNHANSVQSYFGVESHVTWASTNGTNAGSCFYGAIGGGDASGSITGLLLDVVDGGADIKIRSSADSGDYCTIKTIANGATTITTVDNTGANANFEIAADGDITLDSAGDIALEANTTVTGDFTVNGDNITFESANADDPTIIIKNTTDDNQAARLVFWKDRGNPMGDNDRVAEIDFYGEDDEENLQGYGKIMCQALESDHGVETGTVKIQAAEYDGSLTNGLIIAGGTADGVVDVTLGAGAASTTTVNGDLAVTTGLILDSVDVTTIQTGSETFADNDTSLMTSGAIKDYHDEVLSARTIQVINTNWKSASNGLQTETYVGLSEGEESGVYTNTDLPIVAPAAGKLLRVVYRHNQGGSVSGSQNNSDTHTFRLRTNSASNSTGTEPTQIGRFDLVMPDTYSNKPLHVVDFSDLGTGNGKNRLEDDSGPGSNVIAAGDMVYVSMENPGTVSITKFYMQLVFEWDLSAL